VWVRFQLLWLLTYNIVLALLNETKYKGEKKLELELELAPVLLASYIESHRSSDLFRLRFFLRAFERWEKSGGIWQSSRAEMRGTGTTRQGQSMIKSGLLQLDQSSGLRRRVECKLAKLLPGERRIVSIRISPRDLDSEAFRSFHQTRRDASEQLRQI
jgi:hypothetical protein